MSGIKAKAQVYVGNFELDVAFSASGKGVTALFGRSGSGKTTLLRWIAGLIPSRQGTLYVNDEPWEDTEKGIFRPAHRRSVGYVFQEAGLFPHLSVAENLYYGMRRIPKNVIPPSFDQIVELLGINKFLERSPLDLSGGEKQRVAIARSLLMAPSILLLDEPLAALDSTSKHEILPYLESLKAEMKIPIIYVSHSVDEITLLADHIIIIESGRVLESGSKNLLAPKLQVNTFAPKKYPWAVSFIGTSGSGKTTLIESIIPLLKAKGYRVGAIKHDAHQFEIDYPGKDSHRFTQAGADTMAIASKNKFAIVSTPISNLSVEEIIQNHFSNFDFVLTEGYKQSSLPKIHVQRLAHNNSSASIDYDDVRNLIAIATDNHLDEKTLPILNLNQPDQIALFLEQCLNKTFQPLI